MRVHCQHLFSDVLQNVVQPGDELVRTRDEREFYTSIIKYIIITKHNEKESNV